MFQVDEFGRDRLSQLSADRARRAAKRAARRRTEAALAQEAAGWSTDAESDSEVHQGLPGRGGMNL